MVLSRECHGKQNDESVPLADAIHGCWQTIETADATLAVETRRTIRADRSRLGQLLQNFVRNAVEHGGPGVTIAVGDLNDGFYVADDGPGIPTERRERVFEMGYSTGTGTGFGLGIVSQVAADHGW